MVQHNRQGCFRNPPSYALKEQGTVKGKEWVDRRRGEKKILKRGQEFTLPAYLGQLKTGQGKKKDCSDVICDAQRTCKVMG